jgi:hypothetical protein
MTASAAREAEPNRTSLSRGGAIEDASSNVVKFRSRSQHQHSAGSVSMYGSRDLEYENSALRDFAIRLTLEIHELRAARL